MAVGFRRATIDAMAGHSKWKNIRIRKGKQDAIRGKIFTKLSREIIVAARLGGGDPDTNPRLRIAIEKARENSVPVDNIKRSIQRGTGEIEGANYEQLTYEGYGPGGAALIVECTTENRNRTVADIRHAFSKHGGNLAENGSVSWQFNYVGMITIPRDGVDEDAITLAALEAGAEDVQSDEESYQVVTSVENLHAANDALTQAGFKASDVTLTYLPTNKTELGEDEMRRLLKLMDMLEELDDVQEIHINVDLTDDVLQEA